MSGKPLDPFLESIINTRNRIPKDGVLHFVSQYDTSSHCELLGTDAESGLPRGWAVVEPPMPRPRCE